MRMIYLLGISIGIFSVAWYPQLPTVIAHCISVLVATIIWMGVCHGFSEIPTRIKKGAKFFLLMAWGSCWGVFSGHQLLQHQLPDSLDKHDFSITGNVQQILSNSDKHLRFIVLVDSAHQLGQPDDPVPLKLVLLNDYPSTHPKTDLDINVGDRWQFVVRLRPLRGMLNPGGFDYQSWLLQKGYSATGYIREARSSCRLVDRPVSVLNRLGAYVNGLRDRIKLAIKAAELSVFGGAVITALTIGDREQLGPWWDDFTRLGIVHLLVISGLHIGLIAGFGFLVGKGLGAALYLLFLRLSLHPAPHGVIRWLPPVLAVVAAFMYSLLAGFTLPTQRAFIVVLVVMAAKLMHRRVSAWVCLCWACLLIAINQPLAILSTGFWLSFIAVATLIWHFLPWHSTIKNFKLLKALSAQLALFVVMSLPLLIFIGKLSWLAPLVNLVAVPWISFVTIPMALLGVLFLPISVDLANWLWGLADWTVSILWRFLEIIPSAHGFLLMPVALSWSILAGLFVGVIAIVLPMPRSYKCLCVIPITMAILMPSQEVLLRMTVLDVGQGLAVVVETPSKTLVYDSGPKYSDQFSAGSDIVAPYLRYRGRNRIDLAVISHEDADHSGGLDSLGKVVAIDDYLFGPGFSGDPVASKPSEPNNKLTYQTCLAGQNWQWPLPNMNSLRIDVIWPSPAGPIEGNNSSCVLLLSWADQQILLTGDIEARAEREILKAGSLPNSAMTALVAPHHGSKTSSLRGFVAATNPRHVIFSSGFRHHFGHPHEDVINRYKSVKSSIWKTSEQGAITLTWSNQGHLVIEGQREKPVTSCLSCSAWWRYPVARNAR